MASWSWAKKSSNPRWWRITTRNWHLSSGSAEISCFMLLPSSSTSSWPGRWRRISVLRSWASWHPGSWAPSWPCRFLVIIRSLTSLSKLIGKTFSCLFMFCFLEVSCLFTIWLFSSTPQEKMARLAVLLSLQSPPTRQSLIKDAARFGVVQSATQPLQDLYKYLEVEFHPLKLCNHVDSTLKVIQETDDMSALQQYLPSLREITLVRLLQQVAQVYQSICFSR